MAPSSRYRGCIASRRYSLVLPVFPWRFPALYLFNYHSTQRSISHLSSSSKLKSLRNTPLWLDSTPKRANELPVTNFPVPYGGFAHKRADGWKHRGKAASGRYGRSHKPTTISPFDLFWGLRCERIHLQIDGTVIYQWTKQCCFSPSSHSPHLHVLLHALSRLLLFKTGGRPIP